MVLKYFTLVIVLSLISNSFCIFISNTQPQSVESVIAYRKMVKQNNQKYIKASNSKNDAFQLQPYPWLVSLTVEQYSMMYTNRMMVQDQSLAAKVQRPNLSIEQLYVRSVGIRAVNNTRWSGKIKDQGRCGSCYAFAANSLINYATSAEISGVTPIEASEQQIVECSSSFRNNGCDGGWPHQALLYARQREVSSDVRYPYRSQTFNSSQSYECSVTNKKKKQFNIKNYAVQLATNVSPQQMVRLIDSHGVLAIGIFSSNTNFMFYKSGILNNCGKDTKDKYIDHAVTLTGYYSDPQTQMEFWIIKNSWGTVWGQNGMMRLAINNNCKIGSVVCFISKKLKDP